MGCGYCGREYNRDRDSRIKCANCRVWAHKSCATKSQLSIDGQWYCITHKGILPKSSMQSSLFNYPDLSSVRSSHVDSTLVDNNNKNNSINFNPNLNEKSQQEVNPNTSIQINESEKGRLEDRQQSKNPGNLVPFDDGNFNNPFANFDCEVCSEKFTKEARGVLCKLCRSTFHINCLNVFEVECVKKNQFICQHCILAEQRREELKKKQRADMKQNKNKANNNKTIPPLSASTPKEIPVNNNTYTNKKSNNVVIQSDVETDVNTDSSESSYHKKRSSKNTRKANKVSKNKSLRSKSKQGRSYRRESSDDFSSSDSDESNELNITKSQAITGLYLRSQYEKLPVVENMDTKWSIFYELFKKSRKLFSDSHNVLRIQECIKSKEILAMGGVNLFDPKTYNETLELINKHITRSNNLLEKESQEIIKLKQFKGDNKKLIEFIHKIVNYNNIVEKYGKKKDKIDDRIISHIANILPPFLRNSWHKLKAKREDNDKIIYLKTIANFLSEQINTLNSQVQAESRDPWREIPFSKNNKKDEDKSMRRSYHMNENKNKELSKVYCWFHDVENHSSYSCKALWALSGKEVSELARKHNICTFCGQPRHNERCVNNENLQCKIAGCSYKHHILFCYKRKSILEHKKNSQNIIHEEKSEKSQSRNSKTSSSKSNNKKNVHKNNHHKKQEESEESESCSNNDEDDQNEIKIPHSNFYMNNPPTSINTHKAKSLEIHHSKFGHIRQITYNHTDVKKKTDDCLLSVIVLKINNSEENFAFLLDTGSTVSIIEQEVADKLELRGLWDPLRLGWSGKVNRTDYGSRVIETEVSGAHANANYFCIHFRTMLDFGIENQEFDANEMYHTYAHLAEMNLFSYSKISGVIGIDNLWAFDQLKIFKPKRWQYNIPYGVRCPLGDYVIGNLIQLCDIYEHLKINNNKEKKSSRQYIHISKAEEIAYSKFESCVLGDDYYIVNDSDSDLVEDKQAIDMLEKFVKKAENKINYEAPLLWKDENVELPTQKSFEIALQRYIIVEKNSIKHGKLDECVSQTKNLLAKNYAEVVPYDEIQSKNPRTFYIPIFFIHPKGKRSRFIWDAATKVEGKSLNDYLLSGPNMYNDYVKILSQMQEGKFMIKGDLKEMFHQISMRKEDRDSLRFLYREKPTDKLQILRMRVMIFGSKSSPITSQFVKNKIANEFIQSYPDAADIIINNTYVDDVVTSTNDLNYGSKLFKDIRNILKTGGFNLVKLKSNDSHIFDEIRNSLSKDELEKDNIFSNDSEEKLLGYRINFESDTIAIALTLEKIPQEILKGSEKPTKKQVLQLCMSIFDPLGFVEFLLSKFKLLYHWVVKDNYAWNQKIEEKYFVIWKKLMLSLSHAMNIKVPRLYSNEIQNAKIIQLIGFGDAGTEILCNALYFRFLNGNREQLDYRFVCSKSYIVPLKQKRTIPELELDAASKLVILCDKVLAYHRIKINEIIYLTDSSAVFEWVTNGIKNPKVYVKNRLDKIGKFSKSHEWKWIPTHMQAADYGTKITSMPDMNYQNKWFHPEIFSLGEKDWPLLMTNKDEIDKITFMHCKAGSSDEFSVKIENFSEYKKLISYCQVLLKWKWVHKRNKLRYELNQCSIDLNKNKYKSAIRQQYEKVKTSLEYHINNQAKFDYKYKQIENALIKQAQIEAFSQNYFAIKNKKMLKGQNPLRKLMPYIDEHGVMRITSRITLNDKNIKLFGEDKINPIILPRNHHLTRLVILKAHNESAHINVKSVVVNLLQRFYINKIKRTVNEIIKNDCWICIKSHAKPDIPLMGDLPSYRLAIYLPAFTYSICDLFGPLIVKISRNKTAKRWVLVYSCLTTRALHLELIENLDANSTLRALQITFNLRGVPRKIVSDNGTNFTGSYKIIKECHAIWNRELLDKGKIIEPIEWEFSPPRSPHTNGAVERMVGLAKRALKNIKKFMLDKHAHYNDYTLRTMLSEIINMLNSRPIEINYYDEDQHDFLTPNHFIMGRQNSQSVPSCHTKPKLLTQQWEDVKIMANILWEDWLKLFVPNILFREKWIDRSKPLESGDIVITQDPSVANTWRLGVVEKTIIGSKNQVRQVVIKLGKNNPLKHDNNRNKLLKEYQQEKFSLVTRSALAVAKIKLNVNENH